MSEPREQLAEALSSFLSPEQLSRLVDEVLSVTKRARAEFRCKKCGANQVQYGNVPDAKSVAQALTDLLTQAYGRPGEEAHQAEPIQFIRVSSLNDLNVPAVPDPKLKSNMTGRQRRTVSREKPKPEGVT